MIIQLAGLPGTGKSTLAECLAGALGGIVLDKDRVRHAVFTSAVSYTREQDDLCVDLLYQAAAHLLYHDPHRVVIFDGRTCLRAYQVEQAYDFAARHYQRLLLVECVCAEATARHRLLRGRTHVAANRDFALYRRLRDQADLIPQPKITLNTDQPPTAVLSECLRALAAHSATTKEAAHHVQ